LKCLPSPFILSLMCLCLFGCSKPEAPTTGEQKAPTEPVKAPTTGEQKEPTKEPAKALAKELVKAPATKPATEPPNGESFSVSELNLDMLWCKPGTFMMGSPKDEKDRDENETQHKVTLTKGFYLGKHEVTQAQWEKVMGSNPSHCKGATLPVEKVSWDEAIKFCEKLTQTEKEAGRLPEGWTYTLPTEARWEYACRAGTTTAYSFGDEITPKQANYYEGKIGKTTEVGTYPANAWGFHDMHGNVWEWCLDWYGDYPNGSASDPVGQSDGSARVYRGGSWVDYGWIMRSANRNRSTPDYRSNNLGFRLSLQTEKKERSDP
jgi:sulfatase modifying factor 1